MLTRKLISLFFLFTILVNMNFRVLVFTDYCMNTAAYSQNCINKAKPELNCSGKCQMNKKIAEVEKSAQADDNQNSRNNTKKVNLYNNHHYCFHALQKLEISMPGIRNSQVIMAVSSHYLSEVFRPPCA